jgi:hypothetical protein
MIGVGLISSIVVSLPAMAQKFTVAPLVTIAEARSGQAKGSINITNNGTVTLRVRVYAESFTYDRKKGFTFTAVDSYSAVPYLQFSPKELEIPAGVTRNVRVAVALPSSLANQEYRAAVFIEDLQERVVKPNNASILSIKARVASVFFFSKGNGAVDLQSRTAVIDIPTRSISILLENKGKQSAYPEINWRIDKNGQEVAKDIINGVIVQAEGSREVTLLSGRRSLSLPTGEYTLSGTIMTAGQKPVPFSMKVVVP